MARLILNQAAFVWAQEQIKSHQVLHEAINWEHLRKDEKAKKDFFKKNGAMVFNLWFLGKDPDKDPEDIEAYDLPIGDFSFVYTGALGAIKDYANEKQFAQIQLAATKLLEASGMKDYSK